MDEPTPPAESARLQGILQTKGPLALAVVELRPDGSVAIEILEARPRRILQVTRIE